MDDTQSLIIMLLLLLPFLLIMGWIIMSTYRHHRHYANRQQQDGEEEERGKTDPYAQVGVRVTGWAVFWYYLFSGLWRRRPWWEAREEMFQEEYTAFKREQGEEILSEGQEGEEEHNEEDETLTWRLLEGGEEQEESRERAPRSPLSSPASSSSSSTSPPSFVTVLSEQGRSLDLWGLFERDQRAFRIVLQGLLVQVYALYTEHEGTITAEKFQMNQSRDSEEVLVKKITKPEWDFLLKADTGLLRRAGLVRNEPATGKAMLIQPLVYGLSYDDENPRGAWCALSAWLDEHQEELRHERVSSKRR